MAMISHHRFHPQSECTAKGEAADAPEAQLPGRCISAQQAEFGGEDDRDPEPERYFPNPDRPQS